MLILSISGLSSPNGSQEASGGSFSIFLGSTRQMALKRLIPLSSETHTFDANRPHLPSLGETKCYVLQCFGEHDALKSDKPTWLKVVPLSNGMPTFDTS